MSTTWREEIEAALHELGGQAKYKDLYEYFRNNNIKDFKNKKNGKATIQQTIEINSSASKAYGGKHDLFYPVGKIGDGFWGVKSKGLDYELTSKVKDGKKVKIWTTKYERNPKNRDQALKIHGFSCKACGFNFKDTYGDWGNKFIEIHHTKPLYSLQKETIINPEKDLIPVCSNCHRMIHHKRDTILSIDELKDILQKQREITNK